MTAKRMSAEEVSAALSGLNGWSGTPDGIHRRVDAPSFLDAIRLVDEVAEEAEASRHHPDMDIRYRRVTFWLRTHSVNGVTVQDIDLARKIDKCVADLDSRARRAIVR